MKDSGKQIGEKLFALLSASQKKELAQFIRDYEACLLYTSGAALLAVGIELLIGIGIGLIVTVIGLFFGNIIVFDSIALAILAGFLSHGLLGVHPALAIVIGIRCV